ncbi:MAG: hypothetical protein IT531_23570 [Burkholderiales bacterium]|nr:hypothetical protein [Burkholderiales bacterium]
MSTAMQSTMVYLTPQQKQGLELRAQERGTKVAAEIRNAIDAYLAGITPQELEMLDVATRRAEQDIKEMIAMVDATNARIAKRHAAMQRLRRGAKG